MKNLNSVAADLFNKIRGRFPSVTIGDEEGTVTTVPEESRFYDFAFKTESTEAGKVSISLDEENGITVIVGKDIIDNQPQSVKSKWFEFLRELRQFAKKRMLQFDVRDINKSNLQKRDYKHLAATRIGEETMAESKMYGTNKTSYQRIGNARIAIKHNAAINTESTTARTQKIGSIFIESPTGERFRYPFVHLSGARAMARHVSEGGTAYDEFGQYISKLSEELSKLRKFSTYINRNGVMAETLGEYSGIVKERATAIRKEIQHLQKEAYYKEAAANFTAPIVEEVPEDVSENWIEQLTIKQFNEELKDVFPYIYKLVGEATRAKALGPEDLVAEAGKLKGGGKDPCWKGYKMVGQKKKGGREVPNCVPEEIDLEAAFESMMGQFSEASDHNFTPDDLQQLQKMNNVDDVKRRAIELITTKSRKPMKPEKVAWFKRQIAGKRTPMDVIKLMYDLMLSGDGNAVIGSRGSMAGNSYRRTFGDNIEEAYINSTNDAINTLGALRKIGKSIELGQGSYDGNLAGMYVNDVYDVLSWLQNRADTSDPKFKQIVAPVIELRKKAKSMEREPGSGKDARFGNEIVNTLYPLMQWIEMNVSENDDIKSNEYSPPTDSNLSPMSMTPKKPKTPLGEFILSYFDRETGKFPKGETAVLTAVEKDYGDQYVEPARQFIEQVQTTTLEYKQQEAAQSRYPETEMIKALAGI